MKITSCLQVWLLALGIAVAPIGLGSSGALASTSSCERFLVQRDVSAESRPLESIAELQVGSYNVENLFMRVANDEPTTNPSDQPLKNTSRPIKPLRKILGVADAILDLDLDIVVLQEVENLDALNTLNKIFLGDRYTPILVDGNDPRGIDVAFLVKKDLPFDIECRSHRTETWIDPRLSTRHKSLLFSRDLPALVVRARGQPPGSKPLFVIFGTHFKSNRPFKDPNRVVADPKSTVLRSAQVLRSTEIIERYREEFGANLPIILAGDFNGAIHREPEFLPLTGQASLVDAFDVSTNRLEPHERVTHVFFGGRGKRVRADKKQIDALFVSKALQDLVVYGQVYRYKNSRGEVLPFPRRKEQRDRNPSDHWPLKITLRFQELLARWSH